MGARSWVGWLFDSDWNRSGLGLIFPLGGVFCWGCSHRPTLGKWPEDSLAASYSSGWQKTFSLNFYNAFNHDGFEFTGKGEEEGSKEGESSEVRKKR